MASLGQSGLPREQGVRLDAVVMRRARGESVRIVMPGNSIDLGNKGSDIKSATTEE